MARARNDVDIIMDRVRKAVACGRYTKSELAERAGVPRTTLIKLERSEWNPHATTLRNLWRVCSKDDPLHGPGKSA